MMPSACDHQRKIAARLFTFLPSGFFLLIDEPDASSNQLRMGWPSGPHTIIAEIVL
jgi:histone deacetylase complex regulatory component SIN3